MTENVQFAVRFVVAFIPMENLHEITLSTIENKDLKGKAAIMPTKF